jgi:hypothetical protein
MSDYQKTCVCGHSRLVHRESGDGCKGDGLTLTSCTCEGFTLPTVSPLSALAPHVEQYERMVDSTEKAWRKWTDYATEILSGLPERRATTKPDENGLALEFSVPPGDGGISMGVTRKVYAEDIGEAIRALERQHRSMLELLYDKGEKLRALVPVRGAPSAEVIAAVARALMGPRMTTCGVDGCGVNVDEHTVCGIHPPQVVRR